MDKRLIVFNVVHMNADNRIVLIARIHMQIHMR